MLDFILFKTPFFYLIQSVWRDEAFSYFMAKPNIIQIIINNINDFNPPLYYLILHFWMILAGRSDEYLRLLSLFPHLISVHIAYDFAKRLFSGKFAVFVAVFTMFNPMLLYYAFEMRMYSFYAFFTFAVLYFFYLKNWRWYTIFAILGLYTHSFFPLLLLSLFVYLRLTDQFRKKNIFLTLKPLIYYLPWILVLIYQFRQSNNSWLFPVDLGLIKSVLGNLFTSFEGTPGFFWNYTACLSSVILVFLIIGYIKKRDQALLFLLPIFLPLFLILGYSVLMRPLFVNRYMIFITVAEIMGISMGIWCLKNSILRASIASLWIILILLVNIILVPYHKKTDFKSAFTEINSQAGKDDFLYTKTPIALLESAYYYQYPANVFVYNPNNITIPYYIGVSVIFPQISKNSLPASPSRTFFIDDDANYELIINK